MAPDAARAHLPQPMARHVSKSTAGPHPFRRVGKRREDSRRRNCRTSASRRTDRGCAYSATDRAPRLAHRPPPLACLEHSHRQTVAMARYSHPPTKWRNGVRRRHGHSSNPNFHVRRPPEGLARPGSANVPRYRVLALPVAAAGLRLQPAFDGLAARRDGSSPPCLKPPKCYARGERIFTGHSADPWRNRAWALAPKHCP
jgi:hypothetical protein